MGLASVGAVLEDDRDAGVESEERFLQGLFKSLAAAFALGAFAAEAPHDLGGDAGGGAF
ncbi:hypothetical protein HMPREF9440_01100, partial [Sutterella parvirubra YIT 11816]